MVDVLRKTYYSKGVRGLYRGYVATALGVMPYVGVMFFSYDSLKKTYSGAVRSACILIYFTEIIIIYYKCSLNLFILKFCYTVSYTSGQVDLLRNK